MDDFDLKEIVTLDVISEAVSNQTGLASADFKINSWNEVGSGSNAGDGLTSDIKVVNFNY